MFWFLIKGITDIYFIIPNIKLENYINSIA